MRTRARMHRDLLLSLLILAGAASAWTTKAHAQESESLVIGAGDLLHVTVYREHDLEQQVRVSDSGDILLELVGKVHVKGLPAGQAAQTIAELYRAGGYLNHPQVSVMVEESARQQVAVLGEVAHPGTVSITSPRSLLDVLSQAGGLTALADRHVTVRSPGRDAATVFVSNQSTAAIQSADMLVRPGDTVFVPKAGIVYVLGDVARPGGFVMQDESRMSLLEAISLASGTNKTANENGARLIRKTSTGVVERPLELKNIERGKAADPQLEADDIVFVPFSMTRNAVLGATSIIASASSAAVYAFH